MDVKPLKIVYCTPALYLAGGVERVLTLKANYFAEHFGYDITIILTEGKGKPFAYPLSDKIKVVNLDINFEELWTCSFIKKVFVYLKKQRIYKKKLTDELMRIRPDITDSLLRREINFINDIPDGSKKIGELHVNRSNYRNFEANETNWFKELFSKLWLHSLISKLRRLQRFVVLTQEDAVAWYELDNVVAIPNPVSFKVLNQSPLTSKRVIAVGRYAYQKGFDMLLKAWKIVESQSEEWCLDIYGDGDRSSYERLLEELEVNPQRCRLNGPTQKIQEEYVNSSVFVVSSRFEGLSMAMLEAISCGLPIVAFACPCGPRDVIDDGENGILVKNGNIEQLAEKLLYLIEHPLKRTMMGEKARIKSEQYKIENLSKIWQELFESL
ncbi:MAG: glycosyltransferase family 4 protein [Prevotella sp.]|nr:glycosyltransferase family 4 protein [Prevotella sp.]